MCAPRWDSDAVFSTLVGGPGVYAVTPAEPSFVWGGYYEPGTLIWRSRWVTTAQEIECREALTMPGDPHTAVVLRRVLAIDGDTQVRVFFDPRAGFGQHRPQRSPAGTACGPRAAARCTCAGPGYPRRRGGGARACTPSSPSRTAATTTSSWRSPITRWRDRPPIPTGLAGDRIRLGPGGARAAGRHRGPRRPARLRRHARAHRSGGGMAAAATTSLPERAEEGRNYDYRYAWIRDQCIAGQAVAAAGPYPLLDAAVGFVTGRILADGPQLKPAYTVGGGPVPDERQLHLPGYPGSSVKVGNWVNKQFQLDAFGETLLLLAAAARHDRLDRDHWRAVEVAVAAIRERHREPDAGIWELGDHRWAHSRLTCVAGLRAVAAVAPAGQGAAWSGFADALLADVTADCLHPSGRWQRAPDDERVDAALLFPALRGAMPPVIPGPWPPWTRCTPSWAATATCTGTARTSGPSGRPKAPSACAVSPWRWPCISKAGRSRRPAGSSATGPRAARPACSPRNTTSPSGRYAATRRRRSSTPCCSSRPSG